MKLSVLVETTNGRVLVGTLETKPGSGEQFTYDQAWLSRSDAKPLSLSLPLQSTAFSARAIRPYFEGLLPEGAARASVARRLGIASTSYLRLLQALGGECIGAIMLLDPENPEPTPSYHPLDSETLENLARGGYPQSSELTVGSRLSIAGAQAKVGLYRNPHDTEAAWLLPRGTAPSTHIIKPANHRFDDMVGNELFCLRLARACGLPAPHAFVVATQQPMLAVERYDRAFSATPASINGNPLPQRLHQEDFCQALGIASSQKYEENGRHFASLASLIREHSSNAISDLELLCDFAIFNFLIGNCDAHLKNFSLVRSADWRELRLAPCYDLASTSVYDELDRIMGMSLGNERSIDGVTRDSFYQLAKELRLSPKSMLRRLDNLREKVVITARQTGNDSKIVEAIQAEIELRAQQCA